MGFRSECGRFLSRQGRCNMYRICSNPVTPARGVVTRSTLLVFDGVDMGLWLSVIAFV